MIETIIFSTIFFLVATASFLIFVSQKKAIKTPPMLTVGREAIPVADTITVFMVNTRSDNDEIPVATMQHNGRGKRWKKHNPARGNNHPWRCLKKADILYPRYMMRSRSIYA